MSLLYECITTMVAGLPNNTTAMQLCASKLRLFIEDSDQNCEFEFEVGPCIRMNAMMQHSFVAGFSGHLSRTKSLFMDMYIRSLGVWGGGEMLLNEYLHYNSEMFFSHLPLCRRPFPPLHSMPSSPPPSSLQCATSGYWPCPRSFQTSPKPSCNSSE